MLTITAEWLGGMVVCLPPIWWRLRAARLPQQPLYVVDHPALATVLTAQGYPVVDAPAPDALWVAHHYTLALQDAVQRGSSLALAGRAGLLLRPPTACACPLPA